MKYSIDTSAILDGWIRHYPPDIFPGLWDRLDEMISASELVATEEVLIELARKDDDVHAWALKRRQMFIPIDERIQLAVVEILQDYPRLLDTRKSRSTADPFVIALAKIENCVVVTGETRTNSDQKPNIPDVCSVLGIRYTNLLEFIREQGWSFWAKP